MKILVVENDKQLADTFKEFFEFYGHHCEIATNRNAAIMLLSAKKFNTIVADLPLSDFDCRSFVFNILANYPDKKVKVFVISNMI
jgi:DNA-binding response OmpR family regulator